MTLLLVIPPSQGGPATYPQTIAATGNCPAVFSDIVTFGRSVTVAASAVPVFSDSFIALKSVQATGANVASISKALLFGKTIVGVGSSIAALASVIVRVVSVAPSSVCVPSFAQLLTAKRTIPGVSANAAAFSDVIFFGSTISVVSSDPALTSATYVAGSGDWPLQSSRFFYKIRKKIWD